MTGVRKLGAAVFGLIALGALAPARGSEPPASVNRITLQVENSGSGARTYTAQAFTATGVAVRNADLDLGALADDPDLRVVTTPMVSVAGDPTSYRVRVVYPAKGDWVIVVRTHKPSQNVELFTDSIADAPARSSSHDPSSNPSMRAVLRNDPTFYDRYNPYGANVATASGAGIAAAGPAPSGSTHFAATQAAASHLTGAAATGFDVTTAMMALLHTIGAIAWIVTVLGLVLANRVGPGSSRDDIAKFITDRYLILAGGGLLLATVSGVTLVRNGSAGLTDLRGLVATNLGLAYVAVFAVKMVLVTGSMATSVRIARSLSIGVGQPARPTLASVGAMGDNGPAPKTLALAERNLILGTLILGCVVVLGQLHHALH